MRHDSQTTRTSFRTFKPSTQFWLLIILKIHNFKQLSTFKHFRSKITSRCWHTAKLSSNSEKLTTSSVCSWRTNDVLLQALNNITSRSNEKLVHISHKLHKLYKSWKILLSVCLLTTGLRYHCSYIKCLNAIMRHQLPFHHIHYTM